MNLSGSRTVVLEIPKFGGINTAASFSEIDITESRDMLNSLPNSLGSLAKRQGTVPLTDNPISSIKTLFNLWKNNTQYILCTSGTKLYRYLNGALTAQSGTLNRAEIDTAQFKDANSKEVLIITDGNNLKQYDGTTITEVIPAANDVDLPPNDLANINLNHKPTGCLVHHTRVVLWNNTEYLWHSKIGYYDYFRQVDYQRFVRENDYIQTCVSYRGALIVLMRRHIGVLFGHDIDDWQQDFLDTTEGCIAPKTVQTVTYPNGQQEVFYLSDNGVNSIYAIETLSLDNSSRYSTKSVTSKQINWEMLGVTKTEWKNAVAHFYEGRYWLIYKKGSEYKGLVYDTNFGQWYPIDNIKANAFFHDEDYFYFAGDDGHLKVFDITLYSDWEDKGKTSGTPINMFWHSKMLTPKLTGYDHFWDILMIEARQFMWNSTLDVEVNTYKDKRSMPSALKTAILIWGVTDWEGSQWANQNLTDVLNEAKRLRTFAKGQYAQIKISNNRDEPIEVYEIRYEVRIMDTYY
ncbi:MAG: hypothetical protein K0S80_3646 [Neobacillus sp.]|nr:hypothetical protein [Neobacillus sp.]